MNTFFEWVGRNRKTIGYVIGAMNILAGINDIAVGSNITGGMFLAIGALILLDAKAYP